MINYYYTCLFIFCLQDSYNGHKIHRDCNSCTDIKREGTYIKKCGSTLYIGMTKVPFEYELNLEFNISNGLILHLTKNLSIIFEKVVKYRRPIFLIVFL